MATTIKDIARKTNLSITTVSLVLNNKAHKIPQSTRDLVLEAARELNYYPNQIAVSLVKRQSRTLGLMIPDIRNAFFASMAKAIEDEARRQGWMVILCNTNDSHQQEMEYIQLLASKGVDGILFSMAGDTTLEKFTEVDRLLKSVKMPYIMIDRSFDLPGVYSAKIDHRLGGYLATGHLLELGHRRIACITGPPHLMDSNDRLIGYRQALAEYGVPFDEKLIVNGNYQLEGGYKAVRPLKDLDITAIFAFNDLMAFGAVKALKKLRKRVPEDISIVGYDDIILADMFEVPLTTVRQPISKAGKEAVRFLIDQMAGELPPVPPALLAPALIVRSSTLPLAGHELEGGSLKHSAIE